MRGRQPSHGSTEIQSIGPIIAVAETREPITPFRGSTIESFRAELVALEEGEVELKFVNSAIRLALLDRRIVERHDSNGFLFRQGGVFLEDQSLWTNLDETGRPLLLQGALVRQDPYKLFDFLATAWDRAPDDVRYQGGVILSSVTGKPETGSDPTHKVPKRTGHGPWGNSQPPPKEQPIGTRTDETGQKIKIYKPFIKPVPRRQPETPPEPELPPTDPANFGL